MQQTPYSQFEQKSGGISFHEAMQSVQVGTNSKIQSLLFVGTMQTEEDCHQNPWASEAMNVTQLELMRSFRACGVRTVTGISLPGASAWRSKQRFHHAKRSVLEAGIEIQEIPFVSIGPLQPISQILSATFRLLTSWRRIRPDVILVSTPQTRQALPAMIAGTLFRRPVVLIAADITTASNKRNVLHVLRQYVHRNILNLVTGVIVFANTAGREFCKKRPWMRMVRPPAPDLLSMAVTPINFATRNVYFAGSTSVLGGVDLLLEAIPLIDDSRFRFWFSGRGPLDDKIREAAAHDSRITHWGFVERDQYQQLLEEANVLVNPRPSKVPENRYNFPSKLMEYMAAGRPIISTATSDIEEFYQDIFVLLDQETPRELAAAIVATCDLSSEQQNALGAGARQYVEQETWNTQAQRILEFIERLQR